MTSSSPTPERLTRDETIHSCSASSGGTRKSAPGLRLLKHAFDVRAEDADLDPIPAIRLRNDAAARDIRGVSLARGRCCSAINVLNEIVGVYRSTT